MNHLYVPWLIHTHQDSFICAMTHTYVLRLNRTCYDPIVYAMTHSYVPWFIHTWHGACICTITLSCVPWLTHMCHDSFICAMTHSCVAFMPRMRHDSYRWPNEQVCNKTHTYVCDTELKHTHMCETNDSIHQNEWVVTHVWVSPRTEEIRLEMSGPVDQPGFPGFLLSERDSRLLLWKLVWNLRRLLWKLVWNIGSRNYLSPISSARGMTHICVNHDVQMSESLHTNEWGMTRIRMTHDTHMCESWHTYEWSMTHIWVSRDTHMSESRHVPVRHDSCMCVCHSFMCL